MHSIVILVTKPPYGSEHTYGALYTAIASIEIGLRTTLILLDDGVYVAMRDQAPEIALGYPSCEELLRRILSDSQVLVDETSLLERGLTGEHVLQGVAVTPREHLVEALSSEGEAVITY